MKVICSKCGSTASSKCPNSRTIFPKDQAESNFWQGMGFELKPAGDREGVFLLSVTMIVISPETEEEAMKRFVKKMQSMPDDPKYLCKHSYEHTMDCVFCSFKMP